jgi:hypothetical protein
MVAKIFRHLGRNTIAYVALLVALSSGSYAAVSKLAPPNSVGTRQVIDHALLKKDFKRGQLPRGPRGIQGPQGIQGNQGSRGATGLAGPIGPSDAYINRIDTIQALSSGPIQVAALTLPAGSYFVTGKLLADNDNTTAMRIDCTLSDPSANPIDFMKLRLAPTGPPNLEFGDIALAGALTIAAPGTVKVTCEALEGTASTVTVGFRKLIAIRVGAVH